MHDDSFKMIVNELLSTGMTVYEKSVFKHLKICMMIHTPKFHTNLNSLKMLYL